MYLMENTMMCVLHAISPVHAGAGAAIGAVDLPIQRERHTGWPHIQAPGVKGAFRYHCVKTWEAKNGKLLPKEDLKSNEKADEMAEELANRIFGQAGDEVSQAGAVSFSDARLLAFPVRSNVAPFVWAVCPALLKRLQRDLELIGKDDLKGQTFRVDEDSYLSLVGNIEGDLVLEDVCLKFKTREENEKLAVFFKEFIPEAERLVLVPDDHFSFLVETATEVQAQIAIDYATGTTITGSLRYQELLPADTFLYTLVFFSDERSDNGPLALETIKKAVMHAASTHIQMGGDMTLGRGIFKIDWINEAGADENSGGEL